MDKTEIAVAGRGGQSFSAKNKIFISPENS